jgi:hypothetical protein
MTKPVVIVAALVVSLSGAARAATLVSPPLTPGNGNELHCQVAHSSSQPRMVTIEIFGFCTSGCQGGGTGDGVLLDSIGPVTLSPLSTLSLTFDDLEVPPLTPHVCKFTVQGGKGRYRASACTRSGGNPTACVSAN